MDKSRLRIVFLGTPEFAVASLHALRENGYNVVGVVTAPDKPAGRKKELKASAVKKYAEEHGLRLLQPPKLKDPDFLDALQSLEANLQVVVAFRMLPEAVWNMPEYGTFNLHASLLPDYRGAAPINWALINGETETGVTSFFLDHKIDTGGIILQEKMDIGPWDDMGKLHDKLMKLGAEVVVKTADRIASGDTSSVPQNEWHYQPEPRNEAPKIYRETGRMDWSQSAEAIHNRVRGLSPFPSAHTLYVNKDGQEEAWKIIKTRPDHHKRTDGAPGSMRIQYNQIFVSTGTEWIEIKELQPPGKRRMEAYAFLQGFRPHDSMRFV